MGVCSVLSACLLALSLNNFMEAEGEGVVGMEKVSEVTLGRAHSDLFPNDIVDVVLQRKQFSWTSALKSRDYKGLVAFHKQLMRSKKMKQPGSQEAWKNAQRIAIKHYFIDLMMRPKYKYLYFHTIHIKPYWSRGLRGDRYKNHIFYEKVNFK